MSANGKSLPELHQRVVDALRGIRQFVRYRMPLNEEQCTLLGQCFLLPNILHWALHLFVHEPVRSYAQHCPVRRSETNSDCGGAELEAPLATRAHVEPDERSDFCPRRYRTHPWSLQVSLLWNHTHAKMEGGASVALRPSMACAWDVFRGVIDNPGVRSRWTRIEPKVPEEVQKLWERIAEALQSSFRRARGLSRSEFADTISKAMTPELITDLCKAYNEALNRWTQVQRNTPPQIFQRANAILSKLGAILAVGANAGWPLKTADYQGLLREFLQVLDDARVPGREKLEPQLRAPELSPETQEALREYIEQEVLPFLDNGLPTGDPLDDPLTQHLFWDWVGSGQRPDSGQVFDLHEWWGRRWAPRAEEPAEETCR